MKIGTVDYIPGSKWYKVFGFPEWI
jgi:hypothetical protein